jgi:hypothetical protein
MDLMSMLRMRSLFPNQQQQPPPPDLLPGLQGGNLGGIGQGVNAPQMDAGTASFGQNDVASQTAAKSPRISMSTDFDGIKQIADIIGEISNPQRAMQDQLQQHVQNYPIQQEPTRGAKIIGSLAGMAARDPMEAYKVLDRPQDRAVGDWKNKVLPMQNLATNENQDNTNSRMSATSAATTYLGNKRLSEVERDNRADTLINQQRADTFQQNSNIRRYLSEFAGRKLYAIKGGNYTIYDPATNSLQDTGVATGTLSRSDELAMGAENAEDLATLRHRYRTDEIAQQGKNAINTKIAPSGAAGGNSATQLTAAQQQKALELWSKRPDLRKYIIRNASGKFLGTTIEEGKESSLFQASIPPGDPKKKQEADDYIFGTGTAGAVGGDRIAITGPKGQSGTIPKGTVLTEAQITAGWRIVK